MHCTDTRPSVSVDHVMQIFKQRGWRNPGYHYLVKPDGSAVPILPEAEIANGAKGYNSISRHVVYTGGLDKKGKPKDTRTVAQKEALKRYVLDFHRRFPGVKIIGHNEVAAKDCPCFDVQAWLRDLNINN